MQGKAWSIIFRCEQCGQEQVQNELTRWVSCSCGNLWDREGYTGARAQCIAMMKGGKRVCGNEEINSVCPQPLCQVHHRQLSEYFWKRLEAERTSASKRFEEIAETSLRKAAVVYFVRRSDGLIKIGCSVDFDRRIQTLKGSFGPDLEVLWTEPGYFERERELQKQFRVLRAYGEWFKAGSELLEYIEEEKARLP